MGPLATSDQKSEVLSGREQRVGEALKLWSQTGIPVTALPLTSGWP